MIFFGLNGFSFFKLIITILLYCSVLATFYFLINNFAVFKKSIPALAFNLLMLLFIWNFINVLRGFVNMKESATTIFGNINYVLALLFPFFIVFSVDKALFKMIYKYFGILLKFGLFFSVLFVVISGINFNELELAFLISLFLPVVFLITTIPYYSKSYRNIILISSVLLFYVSYKYGVRTMMIREFLLFLSFFCLYLYARFKLKFILRFAFLIVLVPMLLVQQGSRSGESPFQKYLSGSDNGEDNLRVDTRTFLYTELYDNLIETGSLMFGKGAGGKYYSDFFSVDFGYAIERETVEVAILAILLKGGLVAVFLNLLIFMSAIYYAFFKSKNYYVVGIGFVILVYTILFFLENFVQYNSFNIWIWFCIGICFSKPIRNYSNSEIKLILNL